MPDRLRVAIYCRISDDRRDGDERGLGVERQRQDCCARAEREGWDVVAVFMENDVGASTRTKKVRYEYRKLLKLAEDGGVDVILSYSASRLTRRPRELEDLISLYERRGVLLRTIVSGDTDLSTADGRAVARTLAAWDAAEAERIGERVSRAAKQRREQGLRHGGFPPYGYRNAGGGRLEIDPERAEIVREAGRRILAGETLYGVWRDFNRRGLRTAPSTKAKDGAPWHGRTLKRVLTEPSTIGCTRTDAGELRQVVEPVLDRDTWDRLREVLYDPSRFEETRKQDWSNKRRFSLSGLLHCGLCGHYLSGSSRGASKTASGEKRPRVKTFMCATANGGCGKVRIDYLAVERWVLRQTFALLTVPGVETALSTREHRGDDDELRQVIRDDERRLERLDDDYADGVLDRTRYRRQVDRLRERIDGNRLKLAEIQQPRIVVDTSGRSLEDAWSEHADDVPWQRAFLGQVIERVTILSHPRELPSTITARRGETAEQLAERRREHLDLCLFRRVHIEWADETEPATAPPVDLGAFDHLSHAERVALWVSRMDANRPVVVTDPATVQDVAALVRLTRN